ncbi:MAG: hypothetical protein J5742_02080 [Alphaproteobacteria bacterium]|nr:hypothetical protein [Alphaproteobacteria bacterium]
MRNTTKKTSESKSYVYSRKHKIIAWLALIGIFVCGMMTGVSLWGYKHARMVDTTEKVENFVERNTMPCRVKEENLQRLLTENDHAHNARIYEKLVKIGCEKNKERFANFAESERELDDAMLYVKYGEENFADVPGIRPCEVIEKQLKFELITRDNPASWEHSRNARVYSQMAEDGCPENSEKYKQMALDELQIADGIKVRDDSISQDEMRYTVGTYKKLQMQNEARKYIKKAEKLINPGIDFIMELQRVIEE